MSLNGNDYFTYFFDGNTAGCHREAEQVKSVTKGKFTYHIHLSGQYNDGTTTKHNSFAKKHLITFKGGKGHEKGGRSADPDHKAQGILAHRFNKKTVNAYNLEREAKFNALSADGQGKYAKVALGGAVTKRNTVVICDYLDPAELWDAFARGLHEKSPWRAGDKKAILVDFKLRKTSKDYCILSRDASGLVTQEGTAMHVLAHCTEISGKNLTCHIVHFEGVE